MAKIPDNYLTLGEVAQQIKVSNNTIKRWYKWYETYEHASEHVTLPNFYTFDRRGTKFFRTEDVGIFYKLKQDLRRGGVLHGIMAEYNSKYWAGRKDEED